MPRNICLAFGPFGSLFLLTSSVSADWVVCLYIIVRLLFIQQPGNTHGIYQMPALLPPRLPLLPCAGFASVGNSDQRTSSFGQSTDLLPFKSIDHRLQTGLLPPHLRTDRVVICSQEVFAGLVGQRTM